LSFSFGFRIARQIRGDSCPFHQKNC